MKTLGYVGWGGWVGWLGLAWFGLALSLTLLHILWKQAEGDGEIFYTVFMDLEQMRLWMAKLEQCVMNFQMDAFACVPHDWATWRSRRWKAGSGAWDSTMSIGACQWSHTSGGPAYERSVWFCFNSSRVYMRKAMCSSWTMPPRSIARLKLSPPRPELVKEHVPKLAEVRKIRPLNKCYNFPT